MSTGDAWTIHGTGGEGGGLDALGPARPAQPGRVLWLIVAGLFLIAGTAQAAFLFMRPPAAIGYYYEYPATDAYYGLRALVLLACGVLLLVRRSREMASGLALAIVLIWSALYFPALRPSVVSRYSNEAAEWLYVVAFGLSVVAGLVVLGAVLTRRTRIAVRQSRADRITAVVVGFVGAGLWFVGECVNGLETDLRSTAGSYSSSVQCCSWSKVDGLHQSAMAAGGVAMLVLALFAATLRSKALAAGLLIGAVLVPSSELAEAVTEIAAPMQSAYGIHYRQSAADTVLIGISPLPGFWLGLAGLLLLAAAAAARLLLGARENPYSARPYPGLPSARS